MPPRFYHPDFVAGVVTLEGDEFHHLRTVRRLAAGDTVELFDGRGRVGMARLAEIDRRSARIEVERVLIVPPPAVRLAVATAIPKAARMDTLVEKATELGASAILPLVSERSAVSESGVQKQMGWHRRAVEACKQSGRLYVPQIGEPRSLDEMLNEMAAGDASQLMLLADPSSEARPLVEVLAERLPSQADLVAMREGDGSEGFAITAFVGPEGGFSPQECDRLMGAGACPVRMAPWILRIETAAIAVSAAVALFSPPPPEPREQA